VTANACRDLRPQEHRPEPPRRGEERHPPGRARSRLRGAQGLDCGRRPRLCRRRDLRRGVHEAPRLPPADERAPSAGPIPDPDHGRGVTARPRADRDRVGAEAAHAGRRPGLALPRRPPADARLPHREAPDERGRLRRRIGARPRAAAHLRRVGAESAGAARHRRARLRLRQRRGPGLGWPPAARRPPGEPGAGRGRPPDLRAARRGPGVYPHREGAQRGPGRPAAPVERLGAHRRPRDPPPAALPRRGRLELARRKPNGCAWTRRTCGSCPRRSGRPRISG
jgi:hypothetical protein